MTQKIITTVPVLAKLTPPRLTKVYNRTRLFKQLDEARDKPVIWISAPAGSGKTTLIASYLKERKIKPLWYQVDEGDADIASFFYYLGQAGNALKPKKEPLRLLTPEYLLGLPTFTRNFFRELFGRMKTPGVLVLDNYQDAGEGIPLHDILPAGIQEIPESIQVVIISRTDPPTSVARLRASESMIVLGWDQLRLTDDESVEIGKLRTGAKGRNDEAYHALNTQTDGWVSGLVLQLEHTGANSFPESIQNQPNQKLVFDYFAGEIFNKLGKKSRYFLLKLAFLPKITIGSAGHLAPDVDVEEMLSSITEKNYFTVRQEGKTPSFEFHPLFREFLQSRAQKEFTPKQLHELLVQSAKVLAGEGDTEHAIELLLHSQDWEGVAKLTLQNAQKFIEQGRGATVIHWLQALPGEALKDQPWLSYWLGMAQLGFNPAEARNTLEIAYNSFKSLKEEIGEKLTWSGIVDSFIYESSDFKPLDHWIDEIRSSINIKLEYPKNDIEARFSCAMFIALMYRKPEHEEMLQWEEIIHKYVIEGENLQIRLGIGPHLLYYFTWTLGDQPKAKSIYDALLPVMSGPDVPPLIYTTWKFISAGFSWMTAENDRTIRLAQEGLAMAEKTGVHLWDMYTRMLAIFAYLSTDRYEEALPYMQESRASLVPNCYVDTTVYYHVSGWFTLAQGNKKESARYTNLALESSEKSGSKWLEPISEDQAARAKLYAGDHVQALELVRKARKHGREIRSNSVEYLTWLTEYEIYLTIGDEENRISVLHKFLEVASEHDIRNHTHWQTNFMRKLYSNALNLNIEPDYVRSIIKQRSLLPPDDQPIPESWPFPVKIYTLGRFSLVIEDLPVSFKGKAQKKPIELLKCLISLGGREVGAQKLAEAIWPDAEGDAAYQSFTMTLKRLRELIGKKEALILSEGKLTLDPRYAWVDVWAMAQGSAQEDSKQLQKSLDIYQGEFLDNDETTWAISPRESWRNKFINLVSRLGEVYEKQKSWQPALRVYQRGLEVDPIAEHFYQGLMRCYAEMGERAEAVKIYKQCEVLLKKELGISPSDTTVSLYKKVQAG